MVVIARFLSHNIVIANSGGCWLRSFLCCKIKRFKLSNEILNLAKGWWRDSLRRRVWTYWLWSAVSQDCVALLESLPPGWAGRAGRCRWWRPSWSSRVSGWPDHRVTVSPVVAGRQVGNYWAGALLARTLGPWVPPAQVGESALSRSFSRLEGRLPIVRARECNFTLPLKQTLCCRTGTLFNPEIMVGSSGRRWWAGHQACLTRSRSTGFQAPWLPQNRCGQSQSQLLITNRKMLCHVWNPDSWYHVQLRCVKSS